MIEAFKNCQFSCIIDLEIIIIIEIISTITIIFHFLLILIETKSRGNTLLHGNRKIRGN